MGPWLRVVPLLFVGVSVVVLWTSGDEARSEDGIIARRGEDPPPAVSAVPRPIRAPVLVGRAMESAPESEADEIPARGDAVVYVLAPKGRAKRVWVDVYGLGGDGHEWEQTDDQGRVHLKAVPYDGSVVVVVDALPAEPAEGALLSRAHARIRGRDTVIRIAGTMALRVDFRDAESGRSVADVPFTVHGEGCDRSRTAASRDVPTRPGYYVRASISASPRLPLVPFDGMVVKADVSRRATALRMTATLRREAAVFLRAVDTRGRPVKDADVADIEVAGETTSGRPLTERAGDLLRVRGVPFLRGERLRLLAVRPDPAATDDEWVEVVESTAGHYDEDALLPDDVWRTWGDIDAGFGAIAKGRLPRSIDAPVVLTAVFDPGGKVRSTNSSICFGCGSGSRRRIKGPKGDVEVRVVDREGAPIRAARVLLYGRWCRTDLEGCARFRSVPAGERLVALCEPGWVRTRHRVVVEGGRTTKTTVVEDEGGEVLVRVLGDDGLPLTAARIEVPEHLVWADVEDGVQRIDVATDHRGERLLKRFPAGRATLGARWGRRRGEGIVAVESGRRAVLEVRLAAEE